MTFTVPYPPSVNHLYSTVRGRRVLSREGRAFKQTAAAMALAAGVRPTADEVEVRVEFYRPRKTGDLDNRLKGLLDSLTGVAWVDDEQVRRIEAERFDDKANPRAVITITAAPAAKERT